MTHPGTSGGPVQLREALDLFVPRSHGGPERGLDRRALEVHQLWGALLLETRHFVPTVSDRVTVGSTTGYRWSLLGVDIAWVSEAWSRVLPALPPMWSEVRSVPRSDFALADGDGALPESTLAGAEHELFVWDGEGWLLQLREGWRVNSDEPVPQDGHRVRIVEGARVAVDTGDVVFVARIVPQGPRITERRTHSTQWGFVSMLALTGFIGALFGLGTWWLPKPPTVSVAEFEERFPTVRLQSPPPPPETVEVDRAEEPEAPRSETVEPVRRIRPEREEVDVSKEEADREIAEGAGIAGSIDDLLGDGGFDLDVDDVGGLVGVRGGPGVAGLGSRGSGLGTGGGAESGGGLGRRVQGSGRYGFGRPTTQRPKGDLGSLTVEEPVYLGGIDKGLVDEVIQRHLPTIRYCYQRELPSRPDLGGRLVIKFVIARDGSVSGAEVRESEIGHGGVESCVTKQFLRMRFPEPRGGGIVIVSYPFLFQSN